jgi:hypothetical protein
VYREAATTLGQTFVERPTTRQLKLRFPTAIDYVPGLPSGYCHLHGSDDHETSACGKLRALRAKKVSH